MTVDKEKLRALAEAASQGYWNQDGFEVHNDDVEDYRVARCRSLPDAVFIAAANPATVMALLDELATVSEAYVRAGEREHELRTQMARLKANSKLNLCDYPAIHQDDLELLLRVTSGVNQSELAKIHGCTAPNINRKILRVKKRLGWKPGMTGPQIEAKAQQLRELAKKGAVVASDLIDERDKLKAENGHLKAENKALCADVLRAQRAAGESESLRTNAARYEWLRARDVDTIHKGGVFAGMTPQNLVINEETLDEAIDAAMAQAVQS